MIVVCERHFLCDSVESATVSLSALLSSFRSRICFISPTANDSSPASLCNTYQRSESLQPAGGGTKASSLPSESPPNLSLHLLLIRPQRHLIHADHSNLHCLELSGSLRLREPCRPARRRGWILMGVPLVTPDSLIASVTLMMSLRCLHWRSWLTQSCSYHSVPLLFILVCNLLTMDWVLEKLSVVAWPLTKCQIITSYRVFGFLI